MPRVCRVNNSFKTWCLKENGNNIKYVILNTSVEICYNSINEIAFLYLLNGKIMFFQWIHKYLKYLINYFYYGYFYLIGFIAIISIYFNHVM